jgi:hypothetical protein
MTNKVDWIEDEVVLITGETFCAFSDSGKLSSESRGLSGFEVFLKSKPGRIIVHTVLTSDLEDLSASATCPPPFTKPYHYSPMQ